MSKQQAIAAVKSHQRVSDELLIAIDPKKRTGFFYTDTLNQTTLDMIFDKVEPFNLRRCEVYCTKAVIPGGGIKIHLLEQ